ncbi:dipeptide/oligopeptide/nickel ABC transporter permease/ATP-binding protein [Sinisalibacter aestuarii]|uniref:Peptide ABC transporter ATP-binding protein n=1 Tax=Sinisalibacter aestuarii TaxID=2949426 RepID=A0ABQ5LZK3_9RHOB|nr:dipeptide/oligopeptide/nickel ABC transporter permease/ATP-binding protein [Sinisalibacter aestuarii]GKY89890.1 peptide ABC transporter ATP-binding protein [Sinisalibacter aestuarii]
MKRFSKRIGIEGVVGLTGLVILLAIAVVAPVFLSEPAERMDVLVAAEPASKEYWLGTDNLGRDVLARTLVAARLSIGLAIAATFFKFLVGVPLGAALAIAPKRIRNLGARMIDGALALPSILVAIVITTIIGPSAHGAVIAVAIAGMPTIARLSFTLSASVAGRDYIHGARNLGVSPWYIITRHVIPNTGDTFAVAIASSISLAIVELASLSFLGLGVHPPAYDWGTMLVDGAQSIYSTPWAALGPAAAIAISGIIFSFAGEAIGRLLNPQRRKQGKAGTSTSGGQEVWSTGSGSDAGALISVKGLRVSFPTEDGDGEVAAVRDVDVTINDSEIVGILGESGSGKTLMALSLGVLPPPGAAVSVQSHRFEDVDLNNIDQEAKKKLLATGIALVFQDPSASLNPALRVGTQLTESAIYHRAVPPKVAREAAVKRLQEVGITGAQQVVNQYPHEFSGGMRQRAMIAMGLMNSPKLIIADEPTTALDVTVQAQVLDQLRGINKTHGTAILLISHDIAVLYQICTRIIVMYGGKIVEDAPVDVILNEARHPYTKALLSAVLDATHPKDKPLYAIPGRAPALGEMPSGCPFHPRCSAARAKCKGDFPAMTDVGPNHTVACFQEDGSLAEDLRPLKSVAV